MSETILMRLKDELFAILEETFERVQGKYLDRGTSLFETLAPITAEQASRPVSASCACIAAQVYHTRFYLDVLCDAIEGKELGKIDWAATWRITHVEAEEWDRLREELHGAYQRVLNTLRHVDKWEGEEPIGGALAILAHTAYHLGEIRQALCTVRDL